MIPHQNRRKMAVPLALVALGMIAFGLLFTAGGSAHGQPGLVSTNPADIAAGQSLFDAHCESCHGFQGRGGQTSAPPLVSVGAAAADFYLSTGRMPLNDPAQEPLRHHPYFNQTEIRQLVAYIAALPQITGNGVEGPTIPVVNPLCTTGNSGQKEPGCVTLSDGQRLFAVNCAQCHQAAGSGGMLSKGNVIPTLHNANITQVAEAMRIGPKPMPVFGTGVLDQQQMSAIAHYVQFLHQPSNPGGLGISHFGPVAEGFVAIFIGGGILLFAARMIGTRG